MYIHIKEDDDDDKTNHTATIISKKLLS